MNEENNSTSKQFYSPRTTIRAYDDSNIQEHITREMMNREWVEYVSPKIEWWCIDFVNTKKDANELQNLYGETDNAEYANVGKNPAEPIEVFALVEKSPVVEELTRLGIADLQEVMFTCSRADIELKLGQPPKAGDLFRISQFRLDRKHDSVFYKVASVLPCDFDLHRYLNYLINGEQTAMEEAPKYIRDWLKKE